MMHYFLDKDGSRLHTHDKAVMHPDPKGDGSTSEVEYTVVQASGRFAGHGGTFRSRGWVKAIDCARARRASTVLVLFVSKVRSIANRHSTSTEAEPMASIAEAGTEQLHKELIIERFKKIRLSNVSAEFLLLLERSWTDEKQGVARES